MKRVTKTLAVLALLAASFAAGAFTAISRGWGSPLVAVEVVNDSGQAIQSFSLAYSTCGGSGSVAAGPLPQEQSKTVHFSVCGEGGYAIEVVFSDGSRVKGTEAYVESGYSSTEVVSKNGIASNQRIYKL